MLNRVGDRLRGFVRQRRRGKHPLRRTAQLSELQLCGDGGSGGERRGVERSEVKGREKKDVKRREGSRGK
jgi:hypothetical protein